MAYNFNAIEYRNIDQLKSKYDNLKTKTRKMVAQEKAYIKGTGGGGPIYKTTDPVIDMILKIIDWKFSVFSKQYNLRLQKNWNYCLNKITPHYLPFYYILNLNTN